jgi:AcrR family transcriptional regulator
MEQDTQKHSYVATEERRREIAAAARAIILEKGFEGLRTRDIAARVGINIATLHYHVPSKEALIELVGESLSQEFHGHYAEIVTSDLPPLEVLRMLMKDFKEVMLNKPELLQLMDAMGHRANIDSKMAEIVGSMRRYWLELFVAALEAGRKSGVFRASLDPRAAAHMIVGALYSFQYKPKHLLPLFDSVSDEILRSIIAN